MTHEHGREIRPGLSGGFFRCLMLHFPDEECQRIALQFVTRHTQCARPALVSLLLSTPHAKDDCGCKSDRAPPCALQARGQRFQRPQPGGNGCCAPPRHDCAHPGYPKPIYGAAAHTKAMQQFIEIFPDIRVYNDPYRVQFGSGDWITTITRTTGTFTGKMVLPDGRVVPPTGKAFDLPDFVQVVKFEGDRVIEIYAVWDSGLFASQIGLA